MDLLDIGGAELCMQAYIETDKCYVCVILRNVIPKCIEDVREVISEYACTQFHRCPQCMTENVPFQLQEEIIPAYAFVLRKCDKCLLSNLEKDSMQGCVTNLFDEIET